MASAPLDEEASKNVIRQVEFYFSDSNLPRDKFLSKTISESEDGWVSLALICSFPRMRTHLGLGEVRPEQVSDETVAAVAEVLRTSSFLKISEDGKRVGRSTELLKPEEVIEQVDSRTIAASPLEYNVKLEDIESFFSQFAKVNSVRLPRHVADKRCFCGTALIEFSAEEDAKDVLNKNLVYAGAELELKPKKDFDTERQKLIEMENSRPSRGGDNKQGSQLNDSFPKGLIVAFKLKSTSQGEHAAEEPHDKSESDGAGHENAKENENVNKEDTDPEDDKKDAEAGTNDNNANESNGKEAISSGVEIVTREDLKQVFQRFGTVKFVDYSMGQDSGYIRFEQPEAGQKARAAAVLTEEGGLTIKNFIATLEPVTGDAEREYWSLFRNNQGRCHDNKNNRGRGGRNNNRGRRSDGKHPRSKDRESVSERPQKAQKVAAA